MMPSSGGGTPQGRQMQKGGGGGYCTKRPNGIWDGRDQPVSNSKKTEDIFPILLFWQNAKKPADFKILMLFDWHFPTPFAPFLR